MILVDTECSACGTRGEALVHRDAIVDGRVGEPCRRCGSSERIVLVTGGCRARWRYADWSVDAIRSRVRMTGVEAVQIDESGRETPVCDLRTGEIYHRRAEYGDDARAERRDRALFEERRTRGVERVSITRRERRSRSTRRER